MRRKGFTLIEVAMFLAITGMIFVAVAVGTQNSIWQQRSQDAVQNFTEFLREVYSGVSNPQGKDATGGNSEKAIYGKLIVFGEEIGLDNRDINVEADGQQIFVYDIVGNAYAGSAHGLNEYDQLENVAVNVVEEKDGNLEPYGMVQQYVPRWAASIESTEQLTPEQIGTGANLFVGSIMIVRLPSSGAIVTRFLNHAIDVNRAIRNGPTQKTYEGLLTKELKNFTNVQIDFCVNPSGIGEANNNRYDVRIAEGAKNASGIEIVSQDAKDSDGNYLNNCRQ